MSVDDAIVLYDTVTGQLGVDKRNTVVSYPRYLGSSGSMDYGLASYGGKFDSWGAALTATAIRRSQFGVGFASRSVSGGSKTFLFRADVFVHTSITVTVTDVSPTMVDAGTVVTIIGTGFALLISGVVLTESVFNIPGIGRLTVDAILARDYPVIQAMILLTAGIYVTVNLLIDISYSFFDPRIRY